MNTHLHLLEAYTALHKAAPSAETEAALRNILGLFCDYFIDHDNAHLKLFFDIRWNSLSSMVSFGHDIEASWLLWETAEVLADPDILTVIQAIAVRLADACQREGIADTHAVEDSMMCTNCQYGSGERHNMCLIRSCFVKRSNKYKRVCSASR